jgi:metal-responsive CopG/Arc/MetJ family transcriptional regulator
VAILEIISVSLDGETLKELNEIQENLGFKSRSKLISSTVNSLLNEYRIIDSLRGVHEVVFIITYRENERNHVSNVLHEFDTAIKTTIHQHHSSMCLDIMNVDADAGVIRKLFSMLKRNKCVKSINFTLLGHK